MRIITRFKTYKNRWNNKIKKNLKFKSLITPFKKNLLKFKYNKSFKNNFFFKTIKNKYNPYNTYGTYRNNLLTFIPSLFSVKRSEKTNVYVSTFFQYPHSTPVNKFFLKNTPLYVLYLYFNNLILHKNIFSFFNTSSNKLKTNLFNVTSHQTIKYKNFMTSPATSTNDNSTLPSTLFKFKKKSLSYLSIFFTSKFFFNNLYNTNKLKKLKRKFNYYKISKTDWFSNNMAILTRDTIHLNLNTYFKLKSLVTLNLKKLTIAFLMTSAPITDLLKETLTFKFSKIQSRSSQQLRSFLLRKYDLKSFKTRQAPSFLNHNSRRLYITEKFNKTFLLNDRFIRNTVHSLTTLEFTVYILTNPLIFKFFNLTSKNLKYFSFNNINKTVNDKFFYSKCSYIFKSNLIPTNFFNYDIKKKILKVFSYDRLPIISFIWHHHVLIRFLEFFTGKKICLKIFSYLQTSLNFNEKSQCLMWAQKLKYFRKILGPKLFLTESLQIIYLSLKLKDPFLLSNWMVATMQKISFWKYKTFLRYLKYVLRYFFWITFKELNVKGIKFQLKGKVSVAGNARTRTVFHSVGFTSHATFHNKILYKLNLIKTFTGVLGFKLWIVF